MVIEFVREKVLGQQSPQPPPQQTGAGSYASYANDFLSRFVMPQARPSADRPVGGIYSTISGLASSALAGSAGGNTRGLEDAASVPNNLVSEGLANKDSAQRSRFISSERDRLTQILKSLESEQQNIDLAYGSSGGMSKSRSENSFVNVDQNDFQPPPPVTSQNRHSSGGNWGQGAQAAAGWLSGDDEKSGKSSGWSAARDITAAISSGFDRENDSGERRR